VNAGDSEEFDGTHPSGVEGEGPRGTAVPHDLPKSVDVVVEIPQGSRNKYELDHASGRIRLDRTLFTSTVYPADYGFVPDTLAEDGDPIDAMVLVSEPTFPGCLVAARPIGVFWMADEHGPDAKLLCVPDRDPRFANIADIGDLDQYLLKEIRHFFDVYKTLEPGSPPVPAVGAVSMRPGGRWPKRSTATSPDPAHPSWA
jgi:inorganic pyrophosphatase